MPLQKQTIPLVFNQGIQTKTDPFQVPIGQFQALTNAQFNKDGLFQKRNGFGLVVEAPTGAQTLATLNDGLVIFGQTCQSYNADSQTLTDTGIFQPMTMSTVPMVRRATSQLNCDIAVATNGLACTVWMDANQSNYYQISDSITGQIIVTATTLPTTSSQIRVFALHTHFIITFLDIVSATPTLQYIAIPIENPTNPTAPTTISSQASSTTAAYDGTVFNNQVFITLNCSDGGGAIRTFFLTDMLVVSVSPNTQTGQTADLISITVDSSGNFPVIWVTYYHSATIKAFALSYLLTATILAPTVVTTGLTNGVTEVTSTATQNVLSALYEVQNTYGYTPSPPQQGDIRTDYIAFNTLTLTGTAGTPSVVLRGVGLASKAVIAPTLGKTVVLATYGQQFQPTYFLIDLSGNVLARLAYSNGIGYLYNQILPSINISGNTLQIAYLFADLIEAVSKNQGASKAGFYSQYGINLATFVLGGQTDALEIGGTLHASGGMLWQYDGVKIREHGFNVWPEDIEATFGTYPSQTPTGSFGEGANTITLSSSTGILPGMLVTDTTDAGNIPPGTVVLAVNGDVITVNQPLPGPVVGDSLLIEADVAAQPDGMTNTNAYFYQVTYEWTDAAGQVHRSAPSVPIAVTTTGSGLGANTLNIPTLRQTYKTDNVVRIVVYRWSVKQQNYFQVTSVIQPLLNDPTVDYVTFTDLYGDATIDGNTLLYTTGGVIEDICAPSAIAMTLWQSRLFLADAEDSNLLWYSKVVIENTPVEMSDLLTLYIAPTTGAQGSTGPITALYSMDDKLVIFKRDAIYYITGTGPDNTGSNGNFSDPVFISSTVGCTNQKSIVLMPNGLMFQSDKGIWLLGRDLSTTYIGAAVESYVNGNTVTSALCIPETNQVRFTLDNTTAVMYDYFFQRWSNWINVSAINSTIYESSHTFLDTYGRIVQETPNAYLDVDTPVLMGLTTGWINLAGLQGYERFYFANLLGTYYTPFTMNVNLAYDYNPSFTQSIVVDPNSSNFANPWGGEAVWGSGSPWGGPGNVFSARVFPDKQKCQSFQVSLQEVYDSTLGIQASQGLSLSGLALTIGVKRGYRTQSAARSFG